MTRDELIKLKDAVNEILAEAKAMRPRMTGAINWGDLRCVEAAWVENHHGEIYAFVTIEEAADTAETLQGFVARRLQERGYKNRIEVRTEW